MSEVLKKFMVRLASDVEQLSRFIADPQAVAREAGLDDEDRDILLSGDQGRIYAALAGLTPAASTTPIVKDAPQSSGPAGAGAAQQSTPIIQADAQSAPANSPVVLFAGAGSGQAQWPGVIVYVYPGPLTVSAFDPSWGAAALPQMYQAYGQQLPPTFPMLSTVFVFAQQAQPSAAVTTPAHVWAQQAQAAPQAAALVSVQDASAAQPQGAGQSAEGQTQQGGDQPPPAAPTQADTASTGTQASPAAEGQQAEASDKQQGKKRGGSKP